MNDDGTMARMPQLQKFAQEHQMKIITIKDLIAYRLKKESLIEVGDEVDMPTEYGHFKAHPFPASEQRLGTHRTHQRRMERG